MTIEEIWKGAPEGATHYDDEDDYEVIYYLRDKDNWKVWNDIDEPFDSYWDDCVVNFDESLVKPL